MSNVIVRNVMEKGTRTTKVYVKANPLKMAKEMVARHGQKDAEKLVASFQGLKDHDHEAAEIRKFWKGVGGYLRAIASGKINK